MISDEALNGRAVFAADLDGDLDIDVISASAGDNKIAWYQNLLNQLDCNANGISDAIERELDPTLDLDADGILDECEVIGTSYCSDGLENSIGASANIGMLGSPKVAEADLSITARHLPPHSAGFFFVSRTRVFYPFPPNCQGVLCVGGSIGRGVGGGILTSGAAGTFSGTVDLAAMTQPTGPVAVQPGETWYFQAWYRDMNPTITSNLTDAVSVTFQ
ncbi:VCBS repeat-containing protein [bacterium]|nr:VCBS repeat-containing protein [bacterium]